MSFFDKSYQTPAWFIEKHSQHKLSRRQMLKSAAAATAMSAFPRRAFASDNTIIAADILQSDPWQTLNAVLAHLLPHSDSGPGANDIHATQYLYNVVNLQPTDPEEITFIYNGVGWLNDFSANQLNARFIALSHEDKESTLRSISQSRAGRNWINTLLNYIFEALLSPPVYGGNPDGIGWKWLEHQAGFPLPDKGHRYYELPGKYLSKQTEGISAVNIPVTNVEVKRKS